MSDKSDDFINDERTSRGVADQSEAEDYRQYTYDTDDERVEPFRGLSASDYAERRLESSFLRSVLDEWEELRQAPFAGLTLDGTSPDVSDLAHDVEPGEAAPTGKMVRAARALIKAVGSNDLFLPLRSNAWRSWSNPEFLIHENGVRLEELSEDAQAAARKLVKATFGGRGSALIFDLMELNHQLGNLLELGTVMNRDSYQITIFGTPSKTEPWGWQLFGHHVAVNVVVHGDVLTIGPIFLGAEPDVLESGDETTRVFERREQVALKFARSLSDSQLAQLRDYTSVRDEAMPEDRLHPIDERMLAGAFQDNIDVPREGISGADLDDEQWNLLVTLIKQSLRPSPRGPLRRRLRHVEQFRADTWVTWIGSIEDGRAPFYFRIQSPVMYVEFDHHAGIWLNNQFPACFHVHTISRVPGGGDYGGLLRGGAE